MKNATRPQLHLTLLLAGISFLALLLIALNPALACDGCKAALSSKANVPRFGEGMGYSIYFMLSMPFLILATFAGLLYWKVRQARERGDGKRLS